MAKTPKFPDEKLLEAVVKYADQHRGKIEATKLSRWASENIEGLQGVEDRHFMRPEEKKDPKTGKIIKTVKLCTAKINELNAARSTVTAMNTNVLLKSANVDKFFGVPVHEQRRLILETRKQVDQLIAENRSLRAENNAVAAKSQAISLRTDFLAKDVEKLKADHAKLLILVTRAMDVFDESERKKMLASIGVCDGTFDLDTYVDSLTQRVNEVTSLNEVIQKNQRTNVNVVVEALMGGIDF